MATPPLIPPVNPKLDAAILSGIDSLITTCKSIFTKTLDMENAMHVPFPFNYVIAGVASVVGIILYIVVGLLISILVPAGVPLITLFMEQLLDIRKDTPQAQLELSAASLSEFLGVEIDAAMLSTGKGVQNSLQVARLLGDALYNRLYSEFGIHNVGPPGPGEKAARTFSGFAVNFGTQNAMISTLADAISFHELEQFRELGVETARNLGMGRLQRMALGTLMQNVIQKPYNRELQAKLMPDRVTADVAIKAYNAGKISGTDMAARLKDWGYPDADVALLNLFHSGHDTVSDLEKLLRYGEITIDQAHDLLALNGNSEGVSSRQLRAVLDARADGEVSTFATLCGDAFGGGDITEVEYDALIAPLPLTDAEKSYKKMAVKFKKAHPGKQLTWAEVVTAVEQGIVDVDYVERWLASKGFDDEDTLIKELLLAVKFDAFVTAAKAKADALAKKNAAKTPPTPPGP